MAEKKQMTIPDYFKPEHMPLTDKELEIAVEQQVFTYPQVVRQMIDPPISSQRFGNVSFMLFDIPRIFRGKPIYGYMKLRGNFESEIVSRKDAYRIVRDVDSKFQVRIAEVGTWVPITENDSVVKELYDVQESEKETHLRDEIAKQREAETRRIANEIKDAEERLIKGSDIYDDCESINFYTMKRVTEMKLHETYQIQVAKLKELESKIGEQRIIVKRLERDHPNYTNEWIDTYNAERKKTSLPVFIPGETQFEEYESLTLEDLLAKFQPPLPEAIGKSSERKPTSNESRDNTINNESTTSTTTTKK